MSGLEFTDSMVASLAWPVALVVIVALLRGKLRQLLDRVTTAEGMGFKATFANSASDVKDLIDEAVAGAPESSGSDVETGPSRPAESEPAPGAKTPDADKGTSSGSPEFGPLAYRYELPFLTRLRDEVAQKRIEPLGAVVASWEVLRGVIAEAAQLVPYVGQNRAASPAAVDILLKAQIIGPNVAEPIAELRRLRNVAAHSAVRSVTRSAAVDYVDAAIGATQGVMEGVLDYVRRNAAGTNGPT